MPIKSRFILTGIISGILFLFCLFSLGGSIAFIIAMFSAVGIMYLTSETYARDHEKRVEQRRREQVRRSELLRIEEEAEAQGRGFRKGYSSGSSDPYRRPSLLDTNSWPKRDNWGSRLLTPDGTAPSGEITFNKGKRPRKSDWFTSN